MAEWDVLVFLLRHGTTIATDANMADATTGSSSCAASSIGGSFWDDHIPKPTKVLNTTHNSTIIGAQCNWAYLKLLSVTIALTWPKW